MIFLKYRLILQTVLHHASLSTTLYSLIIQIEPTLLKIFLVGVINSTTIIYYIRGHIKSTNHREYIIKNTLILEMYEYSNIEHTYRRMFDIIMYYLGGNELLIIVLLIVTYYYLRSVRDINF